mmetsp:Transcript_31593/g.48299  ORF Transcript_31593/g.48299 Transcript_31593/m.48299 type:complete len:240 (+) Transcript_31593:206-925(+)
MKEAKAFVDSMKSTPRYGLHNPFLNKERYLMLGDVNRKVGEVLNDPEVFNFFKALMTACVPKSDAHVTGELAGTRAFFYNFQGDQLRFMAQGKTTPGDHSGQFTSGYRFPYGPVSVITPFNFPMKLPVLQMMGALYMGNKPLVKPDTRTSLPLEQFVRMLQYCGMPKEDMDFIHCEGEVIEHILTEGDAQMTLFTGSSRVAEHLAEKLRGKIRLEDAGFDWKILGPDAPKSEADVDYVV